MGRHLIAANILIQFVKLVIIPHVTDHAEAAIKEQQAVLDAVAKRMESITKTES